MPPVLQIRFGTANLDDLVESWTESYDRRISQFLIPRLDGGAKIDVGLFGARRIRVRGQMFDTSLSALRTSFDALLKILNDGKKNLTLYDDRQIECQRDRLSYNYLRGTPLSVVQFNIDFIAEAAFWEKTTAESQIVEVVSSSPHTFNIVNSGTAFSRPKVTIVADQGGSVANFTFENTTTEDKWSFTGTVANTKSLVVDHDAGTVLNDGVDAIADFNGALVGFRIKEGTSAMKYTGDVCTIKVDYTQRFA